LPQAEVMMLQEVSEDLSGEVPAEVPDPHGDAEMAHTQDMSWLDVDRMFLLEIIPHHASALAPA
jgi:uncharacterized protein (DUF305 family)